MNASDIEFSVHSLLKIETLKSHGISLSTDIIKNTVRFPDRIEAGYKNRLIAQKVIDTRHVIRVVY